MKTAKEMFKELGYYISIQNEYFIEFKKDDILGYPYVEFDLDTKTFIIGVEDDYGKGSLKPTSMQELQAINKMIEELGWNE